MSKTTFRAILTVLFIMAAGILVMFSDDARREKVTRLVDQGMDFYESTKDSAMTAIDGAQKGFAAAKESLSKAQ